MADMSFNFNDYTADFTLPTTIIPPKESKLNLDLPGESQDNLTGGEKVTVGNMITASNQNNYFTSMNMKYKTSDFIYYLKPEQIQKSAKEKIFKEMVQGKIDYTIFGMYFNDSKFLENLLIAAQDELINNSTIRDALSLYVATYPGNQYSVNLLGRHDVLTRIYTVIFDKLNYVKNTGNVGYLADIQYVLAEFKNAL